jgi:hypothetical protein
VFLVFGPLVLTDIPVTLFSLLSLWALARVWETPDRKNTLLLALSLAGAILSKFTAPLLFIAFGAVALSTRWRPLEGASKLPWRAIRKATLWAGLLVYAVYFLLSWNQPVDIPRLAGHGPLAAILGRLLMPPWLLLRGVAWVVLTGNRPTFLLGHAYPHGVWFYFPVLVVLKSTPGFLGLLAVAFVVVVAGKPGVIRHESARLWRVLWVALVVLALICIVSHFDVSIRHFTTPLVLMILLLAPLPRLLQQMWTAAPRLAWTACTIVVLLTLSCLATAVRAYPNYFPYINPLFAGHPGYWMVNDSNFDWNHALPEVQQFARQHKLKDIPLDTYGFSDATAFVPQSRLWDCQAPSAADAGLWAVVSANMIYDAHNCAWLLQYPHEPLAGGSMLAVQLPAAIPAAGTPGGPPVPEARRMFLGLPFEMRQMFQALVRRPDDISNMLATLRENFEKQMRAAKRD